MSWGNKYKQEFQDWNDLTWETFIQEDSYSGAVTELDSKGTPLLIRKGGSGEHFKAVCGSEATINLYSETDYALTELYTADARKYKVLIYRDSVLFWSGFVLPDKYYEPLILPPYGVSVVASDQIGLLKNYEYVDNDGVPLHGDQIATSILVTCLAATGLTLDFHQGCNLFEDNMDQTDVHDPLFQTVINQDVWLGNNLWYKFLNFYEPAFCDIVLKNIMETFGCRIFQEDGAWKIQRIKELQGSYDLRVFNHSGAYQSNTNRDPQIELTDKSGAFPMVTQSQQMEIIPAYRQLDIDQEFGLIDNLVIGGKFPYWEFTDSQGTNFLHWAKTGFSNIQQVQKEKEIVDKNENLFLRISTNGEDASYTGNPNFNVYLRSDPFAVEASGQLTIFAKFRIYRSSLDYIDGDAEGELYYMLALVDGGDVYYWDGDELKWSKNAAKYVQLKDLSGDSWNEVGMNTGIKDIPASGDLRLRFYRINNTATPTLYYLDNVTLYLAYPKDQYVERYVDKDIINENFIEVMPKLEIKLSDAPSAQNDNKRITYNGTLGYGTSGVNSPTEFWQLKAQGLATGYPIISWLKWNIEEFREDSYQKVTADIQGNVGFGAVIKDPYNDNRLFIWDDVTFDAKRERYNGTMLEITEKSYDRITQDGDPRVTEASDDRITE